MKNMSEDKEKELLKLIKQIEFETTQTTARGIYGALIENKQALFLGDESKRMENVGKFLNNMIQAFELGERVPDDFNQVGHVGEWYF